MSKFMDFMDNVIFGPANLINRVEGQVKLVAYNDTGERFSVQRVDKGGTHTRGAVQSILKEYGIVTFGETHDATYLHFLVKSRQAKCTNYLLDRAGVKTKQEPTTAATGTMLESWAKKNARRQARPKRRKASRRR